jgi:uncharacterized protein (DUF58 family)
MKWIHWKLSARKNSFIVKNFEDTAMNSALVLWDRLAIDGDEQYTLIAEDKMVETVVAVSHYCLKKSIPVDLHYGVDEPLTAVNLTEFDKVFPVPLMRSSLLVTHWKASCLCC